MGRRSIESGIHGVLLLDKPFGLSSNTAVQRVRHLFARAKGGHVGTLDPQATGLLPVCLGEATKFSAGMFAADKTYEADVVLGVTTTTGDAEGEVTARSVVNVAHEDLVRILPSFVGKVQQTPPIYSALKKAGRPLYEYARAGVHVEIAPRQVVVYAIDVIDLQSQRLRLRIRCGTGTYIRVLAEDIGRELGCGASLCGLRRTAVGPFVVSNAVSLDYLDSTAEVSRIACLLPVDSLVAGLPAHNLDHAMAESVLRGQACQVSDAGGPGPVRLYGPDNRFLGLADVSVAGTLVTRRLISTAPSGATAALCNRKP